MKDKWIEVASIIGLVVVWQIVATIVNDSVILPSFFEVVMALAILLVRKRLQIGWLDWMLAHVPMPAAERKLLERWL